MADVSGVSAHTDPDLLGLLALGEDVGTADERAHLESCSICAGELAELRRLAVLGRSVSPEAALATPSHQVWSRIRAELGLDPNLEPPTHRSLFLPSDELVPPSPVVPRTDVVEVADTVAPVDPVVTALEPARSRRRFMGGLVAAAGALVAGVGIGVGVSRAGRPSDEVVARAELSPVLPKWRGSAGEARLEVDGQGHRTLRVSVQADLPASGLRQVWLLNSADPTRMQSIGQLSATSGFWTVASDIDLKAYDLVDVSQQPADGTVVHSGDSIVRGQLG